MNLSRNILAAAVAAMLVAPAAHAEITIDDFWGSEVSFEGLVQADFIRYNRDSFNLNARTQDGLGGDNRLRRAELVLKGKGPDNNEWVVGADVYGKKWLDVNWKYKFGNNANHYLQVGQYKQPNSMEELSSTKNNDFIAKANITNTFGVGRRLGVAYNYGDNNWGVTASVFGRELTRYGNLGNGFGLRGYFAPLNEKGSVLHLGLSHADYNARTANAAKDIDVGLRSTKGFSSRPNADLSAAIINTAFYDPTKASAGYYTAGAIPFASRVRTTGAEFFWVTGPFKLQSEYMWTSMPRTMGNLRTFKGSGGYISGLWNVTGETWGYKAGTPTTGLPSEPATGMLQLGLRYDTLNLDSGSTMLVGGSPVIANDGSVLGGKLNTWTIGANWYWHSNFKLMLNYVMADAKRFFPVGQASTWGYVAPAGQKMPAGVYHDKPKMIEARIQFFW